MNNYEMCELTAYELEEIEGGGPIKDAFMDVMDILANHVGDFFSGLKRGWNK